MSRATFNCKAKRGFKEERFAQRAAKAMTKNRKRRAGIREWMVFRPYKCEHCGKWHISKMPAIYVEGRD